MASDSELGPNSGVMRLIAAGFGELSNCHPEVLALLDRLKAADERIAKLEALRKMALALLLGSDPSPIADPGPRRRDDILVRPYVVRSHYRMRARLKLHVVRRKLG